MILRNNESSNKSESHLKFTEEKCISHAHEK